MLNKRKSSVSVISLDGVKLKQQRFHKRKIRLTFASGVCSKLCELKGRLIDEKLFYRIQGY